jgi:hypothetical protein
MSLPDDLLAIARALTELDPTRPRQASLKRAVSTAYYALFDLLVAEFARLFIRDDIGLAGLIGRTVNHKPLREVSKIFSNATISLPKSLQQKNGLFAVPPDLQAVAQAVKEMQEERELADYDHSRTYTRKEVELRVEQVAAAFLAWGRVRQTDAARLYLACFLLWDTWNKPAR